MPAPTDAAAAGAEAVGRAEQQEQQQQEEEQHQQQQQEEEEKESGAQQHQQQEQEKEAAAVAPQQMPMPSVEAATPIWVSEASSEPPRAAACNPTVTALRSTSGTTMDDIIAVSMAASAAGGVAEAESTSSTDHAMPE